eukprot:450075-Pleurochrysis_carterae.AAC.8
MAALRTCKVNAPQRFIALENLTQRFDASLANFIALCRQTAQLTECEESQPRVSKRNPPVAVHDQRGGDVHQSRPIPRDFGCSQEPQRAPGSPRFRGCSLHASAQSSVCEDNENMA